MIHDCCEGQTRTDVMPEGRVSRFRSSHHCAARSLANFGIEGHQQLIDLVWLWFRSPHFGLAAEMMRTSEPPHWCVVDLIKDASRWDYTDGSRTTGGPMSTRRQFIGAVAAGLAGLAAPARGQAPAGLDGWPARSVRVISPT